MNRRIALALKRVFDIVVSLTVLTLLSPLMALIALAIKLDDGGPVLYVQERVGKDGRTFCCYKFRTTVLAIDRVMREVIEAAQGGVFVPPGDPAALAEAVGDLADDRGQCRRLGLSARAYVEAHFERRPQAERLEGVLTALVGEGG